MKHLLFAAALVVTAAIFVPGAVSAGTAAAGGGTLVFANAGDIWTMHADGTDLTQLTTDPAVDRSPHWSPDGTQIAFASRRTGNFEIWVMNADGSNQHQITHDAPSNDRDPSWTADGTRLVYDLDFNVINIIGTDGTGEQQLRVSAALPDTSPRGLIAFSDQTDGGLYTMNLTGTDVQFVSNPLGQGTLDSAWSPSGDRIAFGCDLLPIATNTLCSVASNGTNLIPLDVSFDRVDFSPTWSPNAKKVAFIGCLNYFTTPDCQIYTVKDDGTQLRQLTTFGVAVGVHGLDWKPDPDS